MCGWNTELYIAPQEEKISQEVAGGWEDIIVNGFILAPLPALLKDWSSWYHQHTVYWGRWKPMEEMKKLLLTNHVSSEGLARVYQIRCKSEDRWGDWIDVYLLSEP